MFSVDYYWIGGEGNWNDLSHWAANKKGTVFHSKLPGKQDDVFFYSGSFVSNNSKIIIDSVAFCRNFAVEDVVEMPIIEIDGVLLVEGNIDLSLGIQVEGAGYLKIAGNAGNNRYINTSGNTLHVGLIVESRGRLNLISDLTTSQALIINRGDFYSNDHLIICNHLKFHQNSHNGLVLGSSKVIVNGISPMGKSLDVKLSKRPVDLSDVKWRFYGDKSICSIESMQAVFLNELVYLPNSEQQGFFEFNGSVFGTHIQNMEITGTANFTNYFSVNALTLNPLAHSYDYSFDKNAGIDVIQSFRLTSSFDRTALFSGDGQAVQIRNLSAKALIIDNADIKNMRVDGFVLGGKNTKDLGGNKGWQFTNLPLGNSRENLAELKNKTKTLPLNEHFIPFHLHIDERVLGGMSLLSWSRIQEEAVAGYQIEVSNDRSSYTFLDAVATNSNNGISDQFVRYDYVLQSANQTEENYKFIRIVEINQEGEKKYSQPLALASATAMVPNYKIDLSDKGKLKLDVQGAGDYNVKLIASNGDVIRDYQVVNQSLNLIPIANLNGKFELIVESASDRFTELVEI